MSSNKFFAFPIIQILFILTIQTTFGQVYQNSYDKGFQIGFKEGVCYNKVTPCYVHLTPMTPLIRINESINSYSDGYNRGFQVGLDLQRLDVQFNPKITPLEYNRFYQYYPNTFKSSPYVSKVDLGLLGEVLRRKQEKFDANFNQIKSTIEKLNDLAYSLFNGRDEEYYSLSNTMIDILVDELNSSSFDYSNDVLVNRYKGYFKEIERLIYNRYTEKIKK